MVQEQIEYLSPQSLVARPQVRKQICPQDEVGLMQSIHEVGILQPIRAKQEGSDCIIVDGHRRTAASIKLGMATVPVIVDREPLTNAATVQRQLIANCQRSDLSAVEKADAIRQLMDAEKCSADAAARKLGMSPATVARLLSLLQLPDAIREQVAAGAIAPSVAYELAKVGDTARQAELAREAAAGTLTRDGVTAKRKGKDGRQSANGGRPVRVTAVLSPGRSVTVAAVDLTLECFIDQLEELLSKARRIRTQGVELSTFIKMLADQAKPPSQQPREE